MAKGQKTGGRQAGTPNKLTVAAKSLIEEVAANLGGADRLLAWAKEAPENERAFWVQVYPKLLPLQVQGPGQNGEHTITGKVTWEIVNPTQTGS